MHQSGDHKTVPMTTVNTNKTTVVKEDLCYFTNQLVNLIFIGKTGQDWTLVDAGMPNSAHLIIAAAEKRFGKDNPPKAIIITHGHFDHIGSIVGLLERWKNVSVYAHERELPFLTGKQSYPTPDTTVEGGLLAKISSYYPHECIDISGAVKPLPFDGSVPTLPEWKWIPVFGHTPGQIALFRERDGVLLSTDALITVRQDSFIKVLFQKKEIQGPPRYFTLNWEKAFESMKRMQALNPQLVISGHGPHVQGKELTDGLKNLVDNFYEIAVPSHGKFVTEQDKQKKNDAIRGSTQQRPVAM